MDDSKLVIIKGGMGRLALAMPDALQAQLAVLTPCRDELDVQCGESISAYFTKIDKLDLLFCNARFIDDKILAKMPEDSWDKVINTNLKGDFLTTRAAAKMMMKQRCGHIIFISS